MNCYEIRVEPFHVKLCVETIYRELLTLKHSLIPRGSLCKGPVQVVVMFPKGKLEGFVICSNTMIKVLG